MARRDVVVFDLDGTLVDSAPGIAAALNEILARRGAPAISPDVVRRLVSLGAQKLVSSTLADVASDPDDDLALFRRILREREPDPYSVYPAVAGALAALARAGWTLGVLTNKPEALSRQLLRQLGLIDFFAAVVGGDTIPFQKPDPAPMLHLLGLLDRQAEDVVFVGDSNVDALTASCFDMPFLLFTGGYAGDEVADRHIRCRFADYETLPALLEAEFDEGPSASIRT